MAPPVRPIRDRILEKVDRTGECWIWKGVVSRDGYGQLNSRRRTLRAHRASYEAFVGPIERGALVCHRCDNPLCVNPSHLFLGSPKQNTQDMISKGRKARVAGDAHPNTKISPAQRAAVCAARQDGRTLKSIAADYGVSFQLISQITLGKGSYATGV